MSGTFIVAKSGLQQPVGRGAWRALRGTLPPVATMPLRHRSGRILLLENADLFKGAAVERGLNASWLGNVAPSN
jgi:hypothetical protein